MLKLQTVRILKRDFLAAACALFAAHALIFGAYKAFPQEPSGVYPTLITLVVAVTVYIGSRFGFVVLAAAAPAVAYFLLEGEGFSIVKPSEALQFVIFIFSSICIVLCISALREKFIETDKRLDAAKSDAERQAMLFSEIAHRIGNDLNVLISICEINALRAEHKETEIALKSVSDRINVFGSIYRQINENIGSSAEIDMSTFLRSICNDMRAAHLALRPIVLETQLETHQVKANSAALIGLILNEAITNALKYAFPNERSGLIHVGFGNELEDTGYLCLIVRDDGVGPSGEEPKGTGIGQRVMRGMASQLGGTYQLTRENGYTAATLRFPKSSLHG